MTTTKSNGIIILICIGLNLLHLLSTWAIVSPWGCSVLHIAWYLPMMLLFLAVVLGIGYAVAVAFPRARKTAKAGLLLCVIYIALGWTAINVAGEIRHNAFERLAESSKSLVAAIHDFEKTNGRQPPDLASLVPTFIASVPTTGMSAYPDYEYQTGKQTWDIHENEWILLVNAPGGFLNWDKFLYYPRQNYPKRDLGGYYERIGDWAYLHE